MFRLVAYDIHESDTAERKDFIRYISTVASEMLINAFERVYCSGEEEFLNVYKTFFGGDFFAGFGKLYNMDDESIGMLIVKKKVDHILEMLRNEEVYYTFDLLEEYMLYSVVEDSYTKSENSFDIRQSMIDRDKMLKVKDVLIDKYNYNAKNASEFSDQLTNIFLVRLDEDEDENLYFWDRDYEFVFNEGFVKGIQMIKSYAGLNMGYGYDYACEMFNNIGMKPPIEILGTKAANDVENEVAEETIRDIFAKLNEEFSGGRKSSDQSEGKDDSNVIPFKK